MVYLEKISEATIEAENQSFETKPLAFEKQVGFPYNDLPPRDFERLVYCLLREEIINNKIKNADDIQLMQGVGERGRDSLILKKGKAVGAVQCKRYKNNLDKSEVGKEIIKFILHYIQDKTLISDPKNFTYTFAVSYGFSEKALIFLNSLISKTFDRFEVEEWAKEIITKTVGLQTLLFNDIKDEVFECLNKIKFERIIPDDLNILTEKYSNITKMFFEIKTIMDIKSFEKLLVDREKENIEISNSSNLERTLNDKNKYLYSKLRATKKVVQNLMNEFSANFTLYTFHNKLHTTNITEVLGKKILDQDILNDLNDKELYVLAVASYLHDIGICIPNNEIVAIYQEYANNNDEYRKLDLFEYIRSQHSYITFNYISTKWKFLSLESELKEAIALVAGENRSIDIFEPQYFEYAPDGGRYKVRIPYLYTLLRIADMIDIENINANYLLRDYESMEEYRFSKKLWEETEITIKTSIKDNDRLVFNGECDDQLLFICINRHIEDLKRLNEQLIAEVRKHRYDAKFPISFLIEDIDTAFSKRIGFSIDYQGISETLIGENIYREKYDALREVIQNSIDSCSYKKSKNRNYKPFIEVELTENALIIRDNGFGMNEYIIENYFSKLCKSYYKDNGIDAIGQFGVGVFSYFMICNDFEVETKVRGEKVLKFKANKNLHSLFYFFEEDSPLIEEGTTITLHLKDKIIQELNFNKLILMIKDYFRYIDIPIKVINKEKIELVEKESFELNIEKELMDRVEYESRYKIKDLIFLESHIENELFEGICGIVFEKSSNDRIQPFNLRNIEDNFMSRSKNNILICQKGVKVANDAFQYSRYRNIFDDLVFRINIKTKIMLNLGRDSFRDEQLTDIIAQFELDLLSKFFNTISNLNPKDAYLLNSKFVKYYISVYSFPYHELESFILDNFYIEILNNENNIHVILSEFLIDNEEFILIGGKEIKEKEIEVLYQKNKTPIVYIDNDDFVSFYLRYFIKMNYILNIKDEVLFINKTKEKQERNLVNHDPCISFNNDLLFERVENINYGKTFYNSNHSLIQFYIENTNQITSDLNLFNKFRQLFDYIGKIHDYRNSEISLKQINDFIEEILMPFNKKIQISHDNFPVKYRKKVLE